MGGSSESEASVSAVGWTGAWPGLDGRFVGAPYPSQGISSARCAGREPGQPGLARGLEGNRGVPGGAARAVVF